MQYYEAYVVDQFGNIVGTGHSNFGVYHVHQTAQENYVFVVYALDVGIRMDVLYYGVS
jgi:hypothetical protein